MLDSKLDSKRVLCPRCKKLGYLNVREGNRLRVTHNFKKPDGKWSTRHHTLGNPEKYMDKLEFLKDIFPGWVTPDLRDKINNFLDMKSAKFLSNEFLFIINELRKLSSRIGPTTKTQYRVRWPMKCPQCSKIITVHLKRVGKARVFSQHETIRLEKGYKRY